MSSMTSSVERCSPSAPAFRSIPAQKVSPLAVRIAHMSSSSSSRRRQALYIPSNISGLKAFLASGRFRVTIRTLPSCSTMQFLVLISSSCMNSSLCVLCCCDRLVAMGVEKLILRPSGLCLMNRRASDELSLARTARILACDSSSLTRLPPFLTRPFRSAARTLQQCPIRLAAGFALEASVSAFRAPRVNPAANRAPMTDLAPQSDYLNRPCGRPITQPGARQTVPAPEPSDTPAYRSEHAESLPRYAARAAPCNPPHACAPPPESTPGTHLHPREWRSPPSPCCRNGRRAYPRPGSQRRPGAPSPPLPLLREKSSRH